MEFDGNEVNQTKTDPESDKGNNLTVSRPCVDISPHCTRYW
jgi:hypothetical protein